MVQVFFFMSANTEKLFSNEDMTANMNLWWDISVGRTLCSVCVTLLQCVCGIHQHLITVLL